MKIHEYQAKLLLKEYGVPCQLGPIVTDPEAALKAADSLGKGPYVVKAQVHSGGRGKAGGVLIADTPQDVADSAHRLIGSRLITIQSGNEGKPVDKIMVCTALDMRAEYYLSLMFDSNSGRNLLLASVAGGTEIEEVAHAEPHMIIRREISPLIGFRDYHAYEIAELWGLNRSQTDRLADICRSMYRLYQDKECIMIELNPLALLADGSLIAGDAKIMFDRSALFRHDDVRPLRDKRQEDNYEIQAADAGLSYVRMNGEIGCLVNGAGLAMATVDMIQVSGGCSANFMDVGGSATADMISTAIRIMTHDLTIRCILVNIFGGMMKCDVVAEGILQAAQDHNLRIPLVIRLAGNGSEKALSVLRATDLDLHIVNTLEDGVRTACALLSSGKKATK